MSFELTSVGFRHRTATKTDPNALADVTATIPAGTTTAILGMSGSGKTTLLNLLGRLWDGPPTSGSIRYGGSGGGYYHKLSSRQAARLRRDRFGFVLQSAFLLGHLTCAENVGVPLALQGLGTRERRRRVSELLDRAGMSSLADRSARRLSGGERQRTAVLRAIVHNPDVLFADEPFSSLDPHNTDLVVALFRAWQLGGTTDNPRTLVLVTHDLPIAWDMVRPPGGFLLLKKGRQVRPRDDTTAGELTSPADLPGGPAEIKERIAPDPPVAGGERQ